MAGHSLGVIIGIEIMTEKVESHSGRDESCVFGSGGITLADAENGG